MAKSRSWNAGMQGSNSQLKMYTPQHLEPRFEELGRLSQRLFETLPVQSAKIMPFIVYPD